MKPALFFCAILCVSQVAFADNCIEFDQKNYCEVWRNAQTSMQTVEFLSSGESLESWSTMITVRNYPGKTVLKDVIPEYINSVKPMFALKPDLLTPDDSANLEEVYFRMLLLAPNKSHYEYVINKFYRDDDSSVKSIFYSYRIPFSPTVDYDQVTQNRNSWMQQLQALSIDKYLTP